MGYNRSQKSFKNILYGFASQLVVTLIPFVTRTVFIHRLGMSYLGVNSLFSNILHVLSLAELGIGNIVVYSLYKPLAANDQNKIASLVKYYRNIYFGIAGIVFCAGMCLLPFLDFIVKLPNNMEHIHLYYCMFVINSSLSYLYVYKSSIINADQKQYLISLHTTVCVVSQNIVQIILVVLFNNFFLYLLTQLAFTFILNFSLSLRADKLYGINLKAAKPLSKEEKREIVSNTKSMLFYKLGGVFLNQTDSIYISTLINTITVGLYANYVTIEGVLNRFINLIYDSIYASVGNLNATEDGNKQKQVYDALCLMFFIIGTVGFVGFYCVSSDVITVWIGKDYIVSNLTVAAIGIRFYLPIVLYPIWMYRNTTGLFKETQNILIYAGIINLLLSYILGKLLGLPGIIFATSIARLLTSFWYEPLVLYRIRFKGSNVVEYFIQFLLSIAISLVTVLVITFLLPFSVNIFFRIVIKVILSTVFPLLIYSAIYFRSEKYKYFINLIMKRFNRNRYKSERKV